MAADIVERGYASGGGALIRGINDLITQETAFSHCRGTSLCVVNGCGKYLMILEA